MLCARPWIPRPLGVTDKEWVVSGEAKLAMTPRPCGQCIPCRINRARMWATRIMLESMTYPENLFVTLTLDDEHIRGDASLDPRDLTLFFKRLRKNLDGKKVRYFAVGEYGSNSQRPHYHLILFGTGLADVPLIEKSWSLGFVHVGFLTEHSARYVTGYVVKGLKKSNPDLNGRYPEFMRCSKMKPGGLGLNAIQDVAASIKESKVETGLVRSFKKGKKSIPIGRYLENKLSVLLGNEDLKVGAIMAWQKGLQSLNDGSAPYVDRVLGVDENVRQRNISRYNFYKSRRTNL